MKVRPSKEEFEELLGSSSVVPVWTEVLADLETPLSAFMKVSGEGPCFLLESVEGGERWGRFSFIGIDPFLVVSSTDGVISSSNGERPGGSPLEYMKELLESYRHPPHTLPPPFIGGAVGYLGYDVVRYLETLPQTTLDETGAPEMMLMFPRTVLAFDHLRQKITIISNVTGEDTYAAAFDRMEMVAGLLGNPLPYRAIEQERSQGPLPPSNMTREEFEKAAERAKEYILAGDVFQVVVSQRFSEELSADPLDFYRVLRLVNPSPYMFFLRFPEISIAGSSPEPLVKVQGDKVVQRPIAGTRPRGSTAEEDDVFERELVSSEKERAEHVMLVDLARNDVGRVCEYGTVGVDELMVVERYSHVMHLVSQVSGKLGRGRSGIDALFAAFPAGTVSGAPKIRAMEIIDELEPSRRGPYAGVVGYFDFSGNMDTCIALRTAYVTDGKIHIQAGAGIVADSDPSAEWEETVSKAGALLDAARTSRQLHNAFSRLPPS